MYFNRWDLYAERTIKIGRIFKEVHSFAEPFYYSLSIVWFSIISELISYLKFFHYKLELQ